MNVETIPKIDVQALKRQAKEISDIAVLPDIEDVAAEIGNRAAFNLVSMVVNGSVNLSSQGIEIISRRKFEYQTLLNVKLLSSDPNVRRIGHIMQWYDDREAWKAYHTAYRKRK